MLEWDQTSLMWATLVNINRDRKSTPTPFCPSAVHPLRNAHDYAAEPIQEDITVLKALLKG